MRKLLLLSLFLCACGRPFEAAQYIDQILMPYVQNYIADAIAHNANYPITSSVVFGPQAFMNAEEWGGDCKSDDYGWSEVQINQDDWNAITPPATVPDEVYRQVVMHHELGHCVLDRVHRYDLLPNGCPVSIMYPYAYTTVYCIENGGQTWSALLDELYANRGL